MTLIGPNLKPGFDQSRALICLVRSSVCVVDRGGFARGGPKSHDPADDDQNPCATTNSSRSALL